MTGHRATAGRTTVSTIGTSASRRGPSWRLVWLVPAAIALLLGLDAGLLLLGVPAPLTTDRLPDVHGMLLVLAFVGTLIALERATALGRWWGFIAPALLGLGGILLVASPVPLLVAKVAVIAGAAAFTLLYIPLWRRQFDAPLLAQLLGAALGLCGAIIWLAQDGMGRVVPWLIGFLVLTIAAERVELARITMGPRAGGMLLAHAWAVTGSLVVGMVLPDAGAILLGISLLSLCGWLVRHDIARRTIRSTGATRYMAACILAGYVWLAVAGIVLSFGDPSANQPAYDAVAHAIFLGYTFSMIMAHATTILPAVLHVTLPYRAAFWVPVSLLQLALIVRIWIGDGLGYPVGWQIGGALNVAALLLFALTAVTSAILGPPKAKEPKASASTKQATAPQPPRDRSKATALSPDHLDHPERPEGTQ
ncbi:hypothetical protein [Gulosibacter chungangensis]|uniref:hypothetical protein n=1 Tax=Gulosibacter chungangensis TaxID=979746 RepID=UPI0017884F90|nr:hypothetical protein [Gulosibacter chungangensis]